ncbi:hypothetical protein PFR86_002093 [Escherichia coli]|nr:hypothetical protein [Escherichia coli]EKI7980937.1 hypothetical protein [Escherichia coli]
MSQEITLQQAAERAHQIEVICALTTLMHALIDIECTAELAQGEEQKDRTQFALECIRYTATRSLNDAKNILVADCENGVGYA